MKIFLFLLALLNVGYLLLNLKHPTQPATITRGDADAAMLALLREKEGPPRYDSVISHGLKPVAQVPAGRHLATAPATPPQVSQEPRAVVAEPAPAATPPSDRPTPAETAPRPAVAPGKACYTLGPFRDERLVDRVARQLTQAGGTVTKRSATERRTRGYWVHLPAVGTRQQAQAVAEQLAAKGFKDYFIVGDNRASNAISLGLFNLKSGADARVQELTALGFKPQVEVRAEELTVSWLDAAMNSQKNWQSQLPQDANAPYDIIPRKCP